MKHKVAMAQLGGPFALISRHRAAYLLRAARSRRKNNVKKTLSGWQLEDCPRTFIIKFCYDKTKAKHN